MPLSLQVELPMSGAGKIDRAQIIAKDGEIFPKLCRRCAENTENALNLLEE